MLRKTLFAVVMAAVAFTIPAFAQRGGGRGPAAGQTIEKIKMLKPNLYEITGGGANTLIRVTNQGLIVVDTKNPPPSPDDNYARVMEEIRSVTNQPVKYVINTQHHPDHVGNNQQFMDAGATVIALDLLKDWESKDPRTKDIPGRATQTFAKDYTLKFGGATVEAHFY